MPTSRPPDPKTSRQHKHETAKFLDVLRERAVSGAFVDFDGTGVTPLELINYL